MRRSDLHVGQQVWTPDNRHTMRLTTITAIGRVYVTCADRYRYRLDNQQRDGYTGRFRTLDQRVDDIARAQYVVTLRGLGVELTTREAAGWTTDQLGALVRAIIEIRRGEEGTIDERD